ncbi:MAG: hypothetical protein ACLFSA_01475 [Spirochaetaceae bacterium]
MSSEKDLEQIIRAYSLKKETSKISRYQMEKYAAHWSEEFKRNKPGFTDFSTYTSDKFDDVLESLEERGVLETGRDQNNSQELTYLRFYPYFVNKIYGEIEKDPEKPFPNEQFYGGSFPNSVVEEVEVKTEFVDALREANERGGVVYRFTFPEGIRSLVVLPDLLLKKMLSLCTSKIRNYLSLQKNHEYAYNKLVGMFPNKESNLRDMFSNIMTQQSMALNTIRDPDDFTFQFWTNLSTMVVNEFREKENKLDREHSFCQSAYLLGMYALYYKSKKKDKRERELAMKAAEEKIKNPPYCHTFSDIHGFKDKNGYPIARKVSREDLAQFLDAKTKQAPDAPLPSILRVRTDDKGEFFASKERALTMILQRCHGVSREIKNNYVKEWANVLGDYKKLPVMNSRKLFQEDIWRRVKEKDPILAATLRFELVYVLLKETKPIKEVYYEAQRILNEKQGSLIPIDEILRLDQKRIITEARTHLPLWKSIPLVGRIGVYLGKLFRSLGKRAEKRDALSRESREQGAEEGQPSAREPQGGESGEGKKDGSYAGTKTLGAPASKTGASSASREGERRKAEIQRRKEYKKAMEKLTSEYVESGRSVDETLKELMEEWNPLVDGQAKKDLVEDVNSAVRDFLRKIRRKMTSPPNRERIQNLASQIAEYQAFSRIKQKRAFQKYIELYMIKLLGQ